MPSVPLPPLHVQVEKVPSPQKSSDHHTALATEGTIRSPQPKPQPQPSPLITPHIVPRVADDVVTMKALGKEGKWEQALEVLKRLKEDAAISGDRSIKPGLEVFNAAVAAVSRSGKLDEVREARWVVKQFLLIRVDLRGWAPVRVVARLGSVRHWCFTQACFRRGGG